MKTLLAILLSFIITEAPVLAIHGGYTLGTSGSTVGTYAGVFIPVSDVVLSGTSGAATTTLGSNNLGLFTLNVPSTGIGTGAVLIFSSGRTFNGTIQGIPDPGDANGIKGLITATYDFTVYVPETTVASGVTTTTETSVAVAATAEGALDSDISTTQSTSQSPTGVLLTGSTALQIDQGTVSNDGSPIITEIATFEIEGFQQSNSATAGSETF
jgi:hypothetical protein